MVRDAARPSGPKILVPRGEEDATRVRDSRACSIIFSRQVPDQPHPRTPSETRRDPERRIPGGEIPGGENHLSGVPDAFLREGVDGYTDSVRRRISFPCVACTFQKAEKTPRLAGQDLASAGPQGSGLSVSFASEFAGPLILRRTPLTCPTLRRTGERGGRRLRGSASARVDPSSLLFGKLLSGTRGTFSLV